MSQQYSNRPWSLCNC